jgi:hypothetical protein
MADVAQQGIDRQISALTPIALWKVAAARELLEKFTER